MPTLNRIAAALLAAATISTLTTPSADAVVGGREAGANDFPFIAEVTNTTHGGLCTGALVSPNYVLTATHCAVPASTGDPFVRVGSVTRGSGGQTRRVTRVINHPQYAGGANDIALLELAMPITSIKPVPIAPAAAAHLWDGVSNMGINDRAVNVGFGGINAGGTLPSRLQWRNLDSIWPTAYPGTNLKQINASAGPCQGDSGGPLLVTYQSQYMVAGVMKAANCTTGGWYSEVAAGTNRDFVVNNMARMPYTFFGAADWDNDGYKDLIARQEATGDILLFPGIGARGYSNQGSVRIGNGWQGYTPFGVADWDKDGRQDIIARHDATGELRLFPGAGTRGYSSAGVFTIGTGYQSYTPFGVGDLDKDGFQDLIVRNDITGTLSGHFGQGGRGSGYATVVTLGGGFNAYTSFGVGDFDGDGNVDLIARNNDAGTNVFIYPGNGTRALSVPRVQIGNGFAGYTPFGLTDWDNDRKVDIITRRDSTQDLFLIPGFNRRGYGDGTIIKIGNGF